MNKEIAENGDGVAPARLERNVTEPIDERREFEKILLGAQVFNNEPSLSGWQLLGQTLVHTMQPTHDCQLHAKQATRSLRS